MNGHEIKQKRKALKMTQIELALSLGVDQGQLSKWENERHKMSKFVAQAIGSRLDVLRIEQAERI